MHDFGSSGSERVSYKAVLRVPCGFRGFGGLRFEYLGLGFRGFERLWSSRIWNLRFLVSGSGVYFQVYSNPYHRFPTVPNRIRFFVWV